MGMEREKIQYKNLRWAIYEIFKKEKFSSFYKGLGISLIVNFIILLIIFIIIFCFIIFFN